MVTITIPLIPTMLGFCAFTMALVSNDSMSLRKNSVIEYMGCYLMCGIIGFAVSLTSYAVMRIFGWL